MSKGKLIVIEGLDGSGKATQTRLLNNALIEKGYNVKQMSFPDYDNPSSALVKMYLCGKLGESPADVNPYAASSFYAVDRYASYKQFWQKDYENGALILADRYTTSNAIYQLAKVEDNMRDSFLRWMEDYEYNMLGLPVPDKVIYLDMPPEISQELMLKRYNGDESKKDLHESNVSFLIECRQSALYSAQQLNWSVITCGANGKPYSIENIHKAVLKELNF